MAKFHRLGRGERPGGLPLVCDICTRVCSPGSDAADWWLAAVNPTTSVRVCRCPQHISTWSIRSAGLQRSKGIYQWAELARAQDPGDPAASKTMPMAWRDIEGEPL